MRQLHIFVSGRVQGVSFRYYTNLEVQRYAISGWVRNLSDGRVEIFVEGNEKELEAFLKWCHVGSSMAQVTHVQYEWSVLAEKKYTSFEIVS